MIELYAVIDHPGPPLPEIAPLRAVARDGLALVCAPAGEVELSPERLWEHERVMEALMKDRDLLPVRYGTRLDDEAAAGRALHERHGELTRALDGVRGAVELSLRVLGKQDAAPQGKQAQSGADYIRAKARSAAARESTVQAVHEPLARLSRSTMQRSPRPHAEHLRAAYLVDRAEVDGFVEHVSELQRANPDLRLLCTGPWPPYSFSQT